MSWLIRRRASPTCARVRTRSAARSSWDVLAGVGAPIVPVWSTTDLDEALLWYTALKGTGVEGIVAKPLLSASKAGRI
ncbi:hypothetical protein [Streptomyces sp. NPDC001508]|uniref:hypothetical protein n=1 Tax=Streptomyces sp. NPDC001508 TaxID=3154656 RepID=UPI00332FB3DA